MTNAHAPDRACDIHVAALEPLSITVIVDAMYQLGLAEGALAPSVRHVTGPRIVGRARTVDRAVMPRNAAQKDIDPDLGLGIYEVIDSLKPGEVLVVSGEGDASYSTFGDNMALRSKIAGGIGIVTDVAVRDTAEIGELGFAAFAGGVSVRPGQFRFITRSINQPVILGGVRVRPGDIVVGDRDGVVVVPEEHALAVAERATAIETAEKQKQASLHDGMKITEAVRKYNVR